MRRRPYHGASVFCKHHRCERQLAIDQLGVGAYGRETAAAQAAQYRSLRLHGAARGRVVDLAGKLPGPTSRPGLKDQRPLSGSGQDDVEGQPLVHLGGTSKSDQARSGEHHRVNVSLAQLAQAAIDVAPDWCEAKVGAPGGQLRAAPRAPGPNPGAGRQPGKCRSLACDQNVPRVGPRQESAEDKAGGRIGGEVFCGVNGDLGSPVQQSLLELLDEDPLLRRLGEGHRAGTIATGIDRLEHEGLAGMSLGKRTRGEGRLSHGKRASARGQPKSSRSSRPPDGPDE